MPKVLVVDDSLSVRKVVEKALEGRSVEVVSAASGAEAIDRIESDRPDIVVCDVILPDKDGYQICEYVRSHPVIGRTPVLLISGVVNSSVLSRAAEVQSNDVMFKPFAADELVRKIEALLGSRAANGASNGNGTAHGAAHGSPAPAPRAVAPAGAAAEAGVGANPHAGPARSAPVSPSAPPPPAPAAAAAPRPDDLKGRLAWLASSSGSRFVALADREGFLIDFVGDLPLDAEVAGAMAACLAEPSEGIGRELNQGSLRGMILEYDKGLLLLHGVGSTALLAVVLSDPATLGKARYFIRKALPELQRAL